MPEDISANNMSLNSENIQKLFEAFNRIDERYKLVSLKQDQISDETKELFDKYIEILQKTTSHDSYDSEFVFLYNQIEKFTKQLNDIEKRLSKIEQEAGSFNDRWNSIAGFIIQLVWVILAAYVLTKLNLQSPAIP